MVRPVLAAISIYQGIVSPQQGQVCAFEPTCSHFSQQALRRHGFFHGGLMTSDRLQRCHFCAAGRYAPGETGRARDPIDGRCLTDEEPSPPWPRTELRPPFISLASEGRESPLAFADHLAARGDFLRAYDQYMILASRPVDDFPRDWIHLRAGVCLQQAGRWPQAQALFEKLSRDGGDHDVSQEALFQSALTHYLSGDAARALQGIGALDDNQRSLLLAGWIHLRRGEWSAAVARLSAIGSSASPVITTAANQLRDHATRGQQLPCRSSALAALFSTALPGSGKMYVGKPLDGLYSLLLVTSSLAVTAAYAGEKQWTRARLFGSMGLFFYLGNIYGSAVEAKRHNGQTRRSVLRDVTQSTHADQWLWNLGEIPPPVPPIGSQATSFERAERLYGDEKFDRAITEYRRHLFQHPGDERNDHVRYQIGLACLRSQRWAEGREALAALAGQTTVEEVRYRSRLQKSLSFLGQGLADQGQSSLRDLLVDPEVRETADRSAEVQYWMGVCALQQSQWVEAAGIFHRLNEQTGKTKYRDGMRVLFRAAREGYQLPSRSPGAAAILSMLVPGSGQIYSGRTWNGLVSLVLNAGVGYLAVDAFRDDRHLDGTLLTGLLWSRFYFGGVHNAARFAQQYNERVAEEHVESYKQWMEPWVTE